MEPGMKPYQDHLQVDRERPRISLSDGWSIPSMTRPDAALPDVSIPYRVAPDHFSWEAPSWRDLQEEDTSINSETTDLETWKAAVQALLDEGYLPPMDH